MNETSVSSSALPTLGDRPGSSAQSSGTTRKRRFGRKAALAAVAGLLVLGSAGTALATSGFNDTNGNAFTADITWMDSHGIAEGFPDGGYHPTAPVTRQAMAAFMHRLNGQTQKVTAQFTVNAVSVFSQTVQCPAGKTPISGGGSTSMTGVLMTDSFFDSANAWHIRWESKSGAAVTGTGSVFVMCQAIN